MPIFAGYADFYRTAQNAINAEREMFKTTSKILKQLKLFA